MPKEATTRDLEGRVRVLLDMGHRADWDAAIEFFAPNAAWITAQGTENFAGARAIRDFWIAWYAPYTDVRLELLDVIDLGQGIVIAVIRQSGRLGGAQSRVQEEIALVYEWSNELIDRVTVYSDVDEGCAAGAQLAEERGHAVSDGRDLRRQPRSAQER
jgi:hypothetical protein